MDFPTEYGLTYPIQKTPGPWIVVGNTPDWGLDIHLDADDPNFEFASPEDWPELDAVTIEAYNAPYRKSFRLAERRMTTFGSWWTNVMRNHHRAAALMECWRQIRSGKTSHYVDYGDGIVGVSVGKESSPARMVPNG